MRCPLRLCFVANSSNIHVKRWLSFFVARGHHVYCLSDHPEAIDGVMVLALPNRDTLLVSGKKANKPAVIQARRKAIQTYLADIQPDILHAHYLYLRGWSAAMVDYHPLVITLLGNDIYLLPQYYRNRFHLWRDSLLNRMSMVQANLVTAVSPELATEAIKVVHQSVPVKVIPIGANFETFHPIADTKRLNQLRQMLNISLSQFVVFSPRVMTPLYNIDVIIAAIPEVLKTLPNAVFILKDTVPDNDERRAYVKALRDQVEALGVSDVVRWVGKTPYEELPLYYAVADCVVSIPENDGMPVTLFEAMACQTAVIAGDLPAYQDVIIHEKSGLRVPLKNPAALAQAIIRLAQDAALRTFCVENAFQIVQVQGNYHALLSQMEALYYDLLDQPAQSHVLWRKLNRWGMDRLLQLR